MLANPSEPYSAPKNLGMGPEQERAFTLVKEEVVMPTVLAWYDPTANTKVSADASSSGLGAVLLQQHGSAWKPVAYASQAMNETEKQYAQIEKEALVATWECQKFIYSWIELHDRVRPQTILMPNNV